ncbi:MAG TPA: prepilin-type N-terminal cleavage/methylation domain-containing protein [Verrucomicrobiota bacterium]|nr:prepilin-type N-terminal cleavage/methylation domain-containing protein [Verrucomicrobiota bacterium]
MHLPRHGVRQKTRKLRGFSLIETLIGVVIVGLCVLAITGGINFCLSTLQSSRQWARSSDILLDMAERLSLVRWEVIEAETFPKEFTALLYPELLAENTNQPAGSVETSPRNQQLRDAAPSAPDSQTNKVEKINTVFRGFIELKPFLGTNNVGYNDHLRHALITVTWQNSSGRTLTNSLEVNLSRNNITDFQEHPAKAPPADLEWTPAPEVIQSLKEEKE